MPLLVCYFGGQSGEWLLQPVMFRKITLHSSFFVLHR